MTGETKAVIISVLGYLILPVDLIADFIPVTGLSDDMAILSAALGVILKTITDQDCISRANELAEEEVKNIFN